MNDVVALARQRTSLLEDERRIFELIADGAPLGETLTALVEMIERESGDMRCAVLLADAAQSRLSFIAAPSLPADYRAGFEPFLRIAPNMGSCGTAAFLRRPVYTRDTASDPNWENFGDIAVRNGLRAVWSTPILSGGRRVLGTFAMYYGEPRLPSQEHERLIDMATQLARVAIEAKEDRIVRDLLDGSPNGILVTDLDGTIVRANPAFARMLGYEPSDLQGRSVAEFAADEERGTAIDQVFTLGDGQRTRGRRYRHRRGALLWARERVSLRPDAAGEPRYFFTLVSKMTHSGGDPLERLSQREREVMDLVIAGRTSKEIGRLLGIAAASVDTYRSRIMQKLEIADLPSLVRFAIGQD